jgi:hypothetical protein
MARKKTPRKKTQARRALNDEQLATIAGGMDVKIGQVTSSVETTDGGVLSPGTFGKIVKAVTGAIEGAAAARRHHYD